jgi:Snf7
LTLDCLVFLHQAMLTSQERILTLPENKQASSSLSSSLSSQQQQQQHDWQHWIRKVSNDYSAATASASKNDDDIGAVLSDLPMDQTLFLLEILKDFHACQVIRRQPKDVNLVVLPETAGGGVQEEEQDESVLQTRITLFDLDCQLQRLEGFMNEYNARIDQYTQQAVRHKKFNRQKEALNCLRHRKLLQAQVEVYQNQSLNLERIQLAVSHSADTNTVFKTFQQAASALKEMRESSSSTLAATTVQNVDDVMDDLEEELELQHKIRATTQSSSSSFLTGVYVDDDDLLNELEQLEDDVEEQQTVVDTATANVVASSTKNVVSTGNSSSEHVTTAAATATTTSTTTTSSSTQLPTLPLSLSNPTVATTAAATINQTSATDDISEQFRQQLQLT